VAFCSVEFRSPEICFFYEGDVLTRPRYRLCSRLLRRLRNDVKDLVVVMARLAMVKENDTDT
jgi:hypothetical protein